MTDLIRILIVEDSPVQATLLKAIFSGEADMEVVGHARNGREGVELAGLLKPDIITMDIEMPEMDGLEATRQVMRHTPTPIIILSTHVNDADLKVPFHALDYGALAVMQKPGDMTDPDFSSIQEGLVETVRAMAEVKVVAHRHKPKSHQVPWETIKPSEVSQYELVTIGCSTGGPIALKKILAELPEDFSLPIIVVQHLFQHFTLAMIEWLSKQTKLKLKLISEGEVFKPGYVYFCPHDLHLKVEKKLDGFYGHLTRDKKYFNIRPSITVLFNSLAENHPESVIAGILTGLGDDGSEGLKLLYERGAFTFVQHPESCVVASMPESAIKMQATNHVIMLDEIAKQLIALADKSAKRS